MNYDIGIVKRRRIISGSDGYFSVPPPAAPSTTFFDPATKTSGVTLSGSNLIASHNRSSTWDIAITTRTFITKVYFKFTITTVAGGGAEAIGIARNDYDMGAGGFIGDANSRSIGLCPNGDLKGQGVVKATFSPYGNGSVVEFAINQPSTLLWTRVDGGPWNADGAANPATGANGYDWSSWLTNGEMYAGISFHDGSEALTGDFSGSGAPSGFGAI